MSKICTKCEKNQPLTEYYKTAKGGLSAQCKTCTKLRVKKNLEKVGNGYDFSEKGVIRVLYKTQKSHQKLRGHGTLPYTKAEFSNWVYENGYKSLYDKWVEVGNLSSRKPSVDRLNDYRGYSFDNMRLVTWIDNREHQWQDIRSGQSTSGERCVSLCKLDNNGNVLEEYVSYAEVKRLLGYCVHYAVKEGIRCKQGFRWKQK